MMPLQRFGGMLHTFLLLTNLYFITRGDYFILKLNGEY